MTPDEQNPDQSPLTPTGEAQQAAEAGEQNPEGNPPAEEGDKTESDGETNSPPQTDENVAVGAALFSNPDIIRTPEMTFDEQGAWDGKTQIDQMQNEGAPAAIENQNSQELPATDVTQAVADIPAEDNPGLPPPPAGTADDPALPPDASKPDLGAPDMTNDQHASVESLRVSLAEIGIKLKHEFVEGYHNLTAFIGDESTTSQISDRVPADGDLNSFFDRASTELA